MASWSKHVVHVYEVLRYVQSRIPTLKILDRLDYWASNISQDTARCEAKRLGYCPGEKASCYTSCILYLVQRSIDIGIHPLCVNCRFKWYCPALDRVKHGRISTPCSNCVLDLSDCIRAKISETSSLSPLPCYLAYTGVLQARRLRGANLEDVVILTTALIDHGIVEEFFRNVKIDRRAERTKLILGTLSRYFSKWINEIDSSDGKYKLTRFLEHINVIEEQLLEVEFCRKRRDRLGSELAPDMKSVDMPSLLGLDETYSRVLTLLRTFTALISVLTEYYIMLGLVARI